MAEQECIQRSRNYFRLVQLTMIEGTHALRKLVLTKLPGGKTLPMILGQRLEKFKKLHEKGVINKQEWSVLYPDNQMLDMTKIDMTLWSKLARNVIKLPHGLNINWNDDEHPVNPGQEQWYHDMARIRNTRNRLFHLARPELNNDMFQDLWEYVSGALRRLDPNIDFETI